MIILLDRILLTTMKRHDLWSNNYLLITETITSIVYAIKPMDIVLTYDTTRIDTETIKEKYCVISDKFNKVICCIYWLLVTDTELSDYQ